MTSSTPSPRKQALLVARQSLVAALQLLDVEISTEASVEGPRRRTLREQVTRTRVAYATLKQAVRDGELPAVEGIRRTPMVADADVDAWVAARRIVPRPTRLDDAEGDGIDELLASGELVTGADHG